MGKRGFSESDWPRGRSTIQFSRTDGVYHPASVLTAAEAIWIVKCNKNGVPRAEMAALLGVSQSTICCVVKGKRYANETAAIRRETNKARRESCTRS